MCVCVMTFQIVASLAHYADPAEDTKQMCYGIGVSRVTVKMEVTM